MADQPVLQKARRYCAYQERSQQELRDKLYGWGLHRRDVEQAIAQMIEEGFLNEQRFATAFAGGRFRMKSWGKVRIRLALQQKKVSPACIRRALDEIDDADYRARLRKVIRACASKGKPTHPLREKQRVARHAIAKGYEPALVWEALADD